MLVNRLESKSLKTSDMARKMNHKFLIAFRFFFTFSVVFSNLYCEAQVWSLLEELVAVENLDVNDPELTEFSEKRDIHYSYIDVSSPVIVRRLVGFSPVIYFRYSNAIPLEPDASTSILGLTGVDQDSDGIRDDVEIYIAQNYYAFPFLREMLYRSYRNYEDILLATSITTEMANQYFKMQACVGFATNSAPKEADGPHYHDALNSSTELFIEIMNTQERLADFLGKLGDLHLLKEVDYSNDDWHYEHRNYMDGVNLCLCGKTTCP